MPFGYTGKILYIDLTRSDIKEETPDDKVYRDFIGGRGLGTRIIYERQQGNVDALGPDNILGFSAGLLVGCGVPGATRCSVVTKSPITDTWGDSSTGGSLATQLKACGYDAIFFTGISPNPVYLSVVNGKVELKDASHLWGKDTFETRESLLQETGDPGASVACIGPAGEVRSLISAIMTREGAAARSGVGAVMGAKRLKAIIVGGRNKVPIADSERMRTLRQQLTRDLRESKSFILQMIRGKGTCLTLADDVLSGGGPIKNWMLSGEEAMPTYTNLAGENVLKYQTKKFACPGCPVACKGIVRIDEGPYQVSEMEKPEYESMGALGLMCLNDNLEAVIKTVEMCNRYGMDTIATGTTIAFAMECYERGIITDKDTGGIELTWGSAPAIIAIIDEMGKRKGFGAVLADGVKSAAEQIGRGSEEYAMHVHGSEVPMHNPRQFPGSGHTIAYICDPTPARHIQSRGISPLELGHALGPYPEFQLPKVEDKDYTESRSLTYRTANSWWHFCDACGFCALTASTDMLPIVDFVSAATGWDITAAELLTTGERIQTLRHAFNYREGVRPQDFKLPERIARPPAMGPLKDVNIPFDTIRRAYHKAMSWNPDTGEPSRQRLKELGLNSLIHKG